MAKRGRKKLLDLAGIYEPRGITFVGKRSKHTGYSLKVTAHPLLVSFDQRKAEQMIAAELALYLRERLKQLNGRLKPSSIERRERQRKNPQASRYPSGYTPGDPNRFGFDSGQLEAEIILDDKGPSVRVLRSANRTKVSKRIAKVEPLLRGRVQRQGARRAVARALDSILQDMITSGDKVKLAKRQAWLAKQEALIRKARNIG